MLNLESRAQQVAQEDLVMFINACYSCSGQREFYDDAEGQKVSINFLHDYILGNYRLLYARTLAAGVNHFNQAQIILKLLATGRNTHKEHRQEEGALIAAALNKLPPQRAWGLLQQLQQLRINNRRARAITREYLATRRDIDFEAIKYRTKIKAAISHTHLKLTGELPKFLFQFHEQKHFDHKLFEQFRKAQYSTDAIYNLPFTIAEGFAAKHKIKREVFLKRIQSQMTVAEKLRYQGAAERSDVDVNLNWERLPLTKLGLYILSLPLKTRAQTWDKFNQAMENAARNTLKKAPMKLGRVAAVLDCSYSSSGSEEKKRRPLGVVLAAHYLLKAASQSYRAFWTVTPKDPLLVYPYGQTDLATPLLAALGSGAETIVIVSDGCENDPPHGAAEVLRVYRTKLDRLRKTSIIHCNPVFSTENYSLRILSPHIPTVGLREAEDMPTMLGFARFAEGSSTLSELETYLAQRTQQLLNP
ncbi:MAG: hypothetical protein IGS39_00715 [Calothrix sp. C42_A2020_038]|nr:hypothetical protein [Calothrix sp. C42_A2020_038]